MAKNNANPASDQPPAASSEFLPDCRLIIASGDKGSTGKSTTLACLTEWLLLRAPSLPMALFDPDPRHRTLTKIYGPNGTSPLKSPHSLATVDFGGRDGEPLIDQVVRAFDIHDDRPECRVSIVDGVANKFEETMLNWARNVELYDLTQEYGFRVTYVLLMNEIADTIRQGMELVSEVGDKADYLVVRNCKTTNSLVWDSPAAAPLRERIAAYGGKVVTIEALSWDQREILDGAGEDKAWSLPKLIENISPSDTFTRRRAKSAWHRLCAQFDAASSVILPPSEKLVFTAPGGSK